MVGLQEGVQGSCKILNGGGFPSEVLSDTTSTTNGKCTGMLNTISHGTATNLPTESLGLFLTCVALVNHKGIVSVMVSHNTNGTPGSRLQGCIIRIQVHNEGGTQYSILHDDVTILRNCNNGIHTKCSSILIVKQPNSRLTGSHFCSLQSCKVSEFLYHRAY